jgi:hypothetical protein
VKLRLAFISETGECSQPQTTHTKHKQRKAPTLHLRATHERRGLEFRLHKSALYTWRDPEPCAARGPWLECFPSTAQSSGYHAVALARPLPPDARTRAGQPRIELGTVFVLSPLVSHTQQSLTCFCMCERMICRLSQSGRRRLSLPSVGLLLHRLAWWHPWRTQLLAPAPRALRRVRLASPPTLWTAPASAAPPRMVQAAPASAAPPRMVQAAHAVSAWCAARCVHDEQSLESDGSFECTRAASASFVVYGWCWT